MAPKRKAGESAAGKKSGKKTIPAGKEGSLADLKLLFTGTFTSMDRETCEKTTEKYGGEFVKKLEDADKVVMGTKPGQKKVDEINDKGLETMSEEDFLELIQTGDGAELPEGDGENDDDAEEEEPAPKKTKAAPKKATATKEKAPAKKAAPKTEKTPTIVDGKADSLKDLKLLFTGTFDVDRKSCEATAKQYGGKIVSKLELADYIVLGTKPGPKKVEQIESEGLATLSEAQFFHLVETGETPDSE